MKTFIIIILTFITLNLSSQSYLEQDGIFQPVDITLTDFFTDQITLQDGTFQQGFITPIEINGNHILCENSYVLSLLLDEIPVVVLSNPNEKGTVWFTDRETISNTVLLYGSMFKPEPITIPTNPEIIKL